jgi:hypothetical protein
MSPQHGMEIKDTQRMLRYEQAEGTLPEENPFSSLMPYRHRQKTFKSFTAAEIQSQAGMEAITVSTAGLGLGTQDSDPHPEHQGTEPVSSKAEGTSEVLTAPTRHHPTPQSSGKQDGSPPAEAATESRAVGMSKKTTVPKVSRKGKQVEPRHSSVSDEIGKWSPPEEEPPKKPLYGSVGGWKFAKEEEDSAGSHPNTSNAVTESEEDDKYSKRSSSPLPASWKATRNTQRHSAQLLASATPSGTADDASKATRATPNPVWKASRPQTNTPSLKRAHTSRTVEAGGTSSCICAVM